MRDNSIKKKLLVLLSLIILVVSILIGGSYAYFKIQVGGSKKQVVQAGDITLILDEGDDLSTILASHNIPMKDEDGKQTEEFTFSIVNKNTNDVAYTLYIVDDTLTDGAVRVADSNIKYYLIKDEIERSPALLSTLETDTTGRILDEELIAGKTGDTNTVIQYSLRFWLDYDAGNEVMGQEFSIKLVVVTEQVPLFKDMIIDAKPVTAQMFNYSASGHNGDGTLMVDSTHGIYTMDDDDGPSAFYRGNVDNWVQFGEYAVDHYVYRYVKGTATYEFANLDSCAAFVTEYGNEGDTCTEDNRILKYPVGTPMYWRIVRINGDGTIRMVYSGTSTDAFGFDTGIGASMYNTAYDNPMFSGYTYNRTTTEMSSLVKTEIDNWYNSNLANTDFDSYVVEGKFCSNTSNYSEFPELFEGVYAFDSYRRTAAMWAGEDSNPSLKCPETKETFGGSYNLKAGMMTVDEMVMAGAVYGFGFYNTDFYLYNGVGFWSMSPAVFMGTATTYGTSGNGQGTVSYLWSSGTLFGIEDPDAVINPMGLVRPVINLRKDVLFQEGTNGSIVAPYKLSMTDSSN